MTTTQSTISSPLILPKHPYSRDELEDYVSRFLENKLKDKKQHDQAERRLVHYIEYLPAWAQVLIIENRVPFELGSRQTLKLPKNVVANMTPETYVVRATSSLLRAPNEEAEFYLSHEIGHVIDNILGIYRRLPADLGTVSYMSETNPTWIARMNRDLDIKSTRRKNDINTQMRHFLTKGGYTKEEYPRETFAYILSHYLTECFRAHTPVLLNNGAWSGLANETDINDHMQHYFPALWPQFRDHILPHALKLAGKQYHDRRDREAEANDLNTQAITQSINSIIDSYGCPPLRDANLARNLALSYYTDWQNLFERLSEPLPDGVNPRLKVLFPAFFDPTWGAPEERINGKNKAYTLRSFPDIKREAEYFVTHIPDILRDVGIEGFIKDYEHLWQNFEASIKARQPKARSH
jgi:hypothetical protein